MNVIDDLQHQLDDNVITEIQHEIGAESKEQTEAAATGIISTLVAALSRNTNQPGGANSLLSALDRDHDGSILDDVTGFLFGRRQPQNEKTMNGVGILDHVLGNKKEGVENMMSKVTGLKNGQIGKMLIMLAPMVLAALGRARRNKGLDGNGIGDLLRGSVNTRATQHKEMGLLQRWLDSDGDGKILDDIANLGMKPFLARR
jgi:hypothetical protein